MTPFILGNPMLLGVTDIVSFTWNPWYALVVGLIGLSLYLFQGIGVPARYGSRFFVGLLALLGAMGLDGWHREMTWESATVYLFEWVAMVGGIGFVAFRQPVYAALSFATAVMGSCALFVYLGAPFLATGTMIVYAGATIIIFLFVLMFAQRSQLQSYDIKMSYPGVSILAGMFVLFVLMTAIPGMPLPSPASETSLKVEDLGSSLYQDYLWTVEIAGTLLLVATIGAIVIAFDFPWAGIPRTGTMRDPDSNEAHRREEKSALKSGGAR